MKLRLALTGVVVLALVGLVARAPEVAGAAAFVGVVWVLGWEYGRRSAAALAAEQTVTPTRMAPGREATIVLAVSNPLPWPVPGLEWEDDLPESFEILSAESRSASALPRRQRLFGGFGLGPAERVRRRLTVRPTRRGRYLLGPVGLHLRDPLGIGEWHVTRETPAVLTVYPALYPVPASLWRPALPRGQRRGPPWNPPDPSRQLGVRPYMAGDAPRLVHPYATARLGSLQVRRLETEGEDVVELAVLAATALHVWHGVEVERLEAVVAAAASAASLYLRQRAAVGLSLAGAVPGSPGGVAFPPQRGPAQRDRILTALAWVGPGGGDAADFGRTLSTLAGRLAAGATVVVFTTFYDGSWAPAVRALQQAGARLAWVAVAFRGRPPQFPGIPVHPWTPGPVRTAPS